MCQTLRPRRYPLATPLSYLYAIGPHLTILYGLANTPIEETVLGRDCHSRESDL